MTSGNIDIDMNKYVQGLNVKAHKKSSPKSCHNSKYMLKSAKKLMKIKLVERQANISGTCMNFRLEMPKQEKNIEKCNESQLFKSGSSLSDLNSLGKTYLIKSTGQDDASRQVCGLQTVKDSFECRETFVLRRNVYEALMNIGKNPGNSQRDIEILKNEIRNAASGSDIYLAIENYNTLLGMKMDDDIELI